MSKELERTKKALDRAMRCLQGFSKLRMDLLIVDINKRADIAIRDVGSILHPWEDVELVRWECTNCGTIHKDISDGCGCMSADYHYSEADFAKLTGTLRRPKSQPVERSATGRVTGEDFGGPSGLIKIAMDAPSDAHTLRNKPVVITWTE